MSNVEVSDKGKSMTNTTQTNGSPTETVAETIDCHETRVNQSSVAIVGMSCLFPRAQSLKQYWANIHGRVDAITEVPESHWKPDDYFDHDPKRPDFTYARRGGFLSPVPFDPTEFGISPNTLEATDTSQLLGLVVAQGALIDAGYGAERDFDRSRVSVILGVTGALELVIPLGARLGHPIWRKAMRDSGVTEVVSDEVIDRIGDSYVKWQEDSFPGLLGNVVAGRVANRLNLGGTNCVVDAACASSLSAAHMATMELVSGRADMVVTGGVDTFNDIFMYMCFSKTPALSPTGDSRPFDAAADGTILGEGVGMVVLKRLADAERDGDSIYAVIRGIGTSSDGRGKAIYTPSSPGQAKCLRDAYEQAGISPATVELVEAHGTGTKVGDATEVTALREVFRAARASGVWCALGSVKSQIGHTKAAAGAASLVKTALALRHKVLPPTIKVDEINPGVAPGEGPFYVNTQKRPWLPNAGHPRRAGVSSFGFGGSNFHVVLEEHDSQKTSVDWTGEVQLFALSTRSLEVLKSMLHDLAAKAQESWEELSRRAATTRKEFSHLDPYRLVVVVEKLKTDMVAVCHKLVEKLDQHGDQPSWTTSDACYGSAEPGKVGVLFPGQGAQYVGMGLDLTCHFPEAHAALAEANEVFAQSAGPEPRLSDVIYPLPPLTDEHKKANEAALQTTMVAQPALGALGLAGWRVLQKFGVKADAFAGHSYGELIALCAADRIDTRTLHWLSRLRGELMARVSGAGDPGSMVAVQTSAETAAQVIAEEKLELTIANKNSPKQTVLSGATEAIKAAAAAFKQRKIGATILSVAAAFHSPFVADASKPFSTALKDVDLQPGVSPVFANTTGDAYPADAEAARNLLGQQLANSVEFVREIENLYAAGIRTFLEVGPGARLTGLVKAILGEQNHAAFALDASNGRGSGWHDLAKTVACLAALGHVVDLTLWERDARADAEPKKPKMTIFLTGANYRSPNTNGESVNGNGNKSRPVQLAISPTTPGRVSPPSVAHPRPEPAAAMAPAPTPVPSAVVTPVPMPTVASIPPRTVAELLRTTQEGLTALQQLQQQTAQVHIKFLEGQETATLTLSKLIEQQQKLFGVTPTSPIALPQPSALVAVRPPESIALTPTPVAPPAPVPKPVTIPSPVSVPPPPVAPIATPIRQSRAHFATVLLDIVSEKTGYPVEMLNPEMDMESDLGIDSIKRVEILSEAQVRLPEAPVVQPENLGEFRTLQQVIDFLTAEAASPAATTIAVPSVTVAAEFTTTLLGIVSEKTGYPVEMLNLDMDMESDLGIDSIKRVEILSEVQVRLPSAPVVQPENLGEFRSLQQVIDFLMAGAPGVALQPATEPAPPTSRIDLDECRATVLAIVSEKTGYPIEMLNLEMDMESDLGIDSIKRVEILSEVQVRLPDAPVVQPENLGEFRTLQQVINFLAVPGPSAVSASVSASDGISAMVTAIVSEKTGYPADMIGLGMDLEKDLGIDSIKRVEIMSEVQLRLPDAPVVQPQQLGEFHTLGHLVGYLNGKAVSMAPATPPESNATPILVEAVRLNRRALVVAQLGARSEDRLRLRPDSEVWVTEDKVGLSDALVQQLNEQGIEARVVSLRKFPKLKAKPSLAGLVIVAPGSARADCDQFLKAAFALTRYVGPALREAGKHGGALFATVSRLDGAFGLNADLTEADAAQGGLAGLAKTVKQEWSEVTSRALDIAAGWNEASEVAAELLHVGPIEVGLSSAGRVTLAESAVPPGLQGPALQPGEIVLVTGGGRGVTAECAVAVAQAFQPTLVLLGRTPLPPAEVPWLADATTEAEMKKAILANAGKSLKPAELEAEYRRLAAEREIRGTLGRIAAGGSRVEYRAVDARNSGAVRAMVDEVRALLGPIRGIIHGAGVLADRLIEDKTPDQFALVYDTKVVGLRNLLAATADDNLKLLALFSSVTGRYGRTGQVDYAIANEALNKIALREARHRPNARVVAVNWGPWAGGMVTPALSKLFAAQGVDLIPLDAGAQALVAELHAPASDAVEVIIGGRFGPATLATAPAQLPSELKLAFERQLNADQYEFLRSHVINGKSVLPAAMMMEWLAHGALHQNPGLQFHGLDNFRVTKGVVLEGSYPVRVLATKAVRQVEGFVATAELRGGSSPEVIHASAQVLLTERLPAATNGLARPNERARYARTVDSVYDEVLFHGPHFRAIEEISVLTAEGIIARVAAAPAPSAWMSQPLRTAWLCDPLAVDAAFQLMVLWTYERFGEASLPSFVARYRQYGEFPREGVTVVHRTEQNGSKIARADMEFRAADGRLVATIGGYECTMSPKLLEAFGK